MGSISVLVYYNGKWDRSRCYNDYSMVGITVPLDCSYMALLGIIMKELKMDDFEYRITVQYQVLANGPLIQIDTDSSLYFYIQVKQGETNLTNYPLCVDIEKLDTNENNLTYLCNSVNEGVAGSFHDRSVNDNTGFGSMENLMITKFPTIQEMGDDICENVTYGDNNIEERSTNIISRPSIEDV
ncbi:uncharacterized protein Fot_36826 [Forsythia ovata]|uniref:Uncharacterized protein n=1 Tax=Forsythia ovata TaxID=205694 RepID=A0ABD1SRL3_9LAMI